MSTDNKSFTINDIDKMIRDQIDKLSIFKNSWEDNDDSSTLSKQESVESKNNWADDECSSTLSKQSSREFKTSWADESDEEELIYVEEPKEEAKFETEEVKTHNYSKHKKYNRKKQKKKVGTVFDYEISEKQLNNNIYVDNTEEYVYNLEKNIRPCKFGIRCSRLRCDFMHVFPEAECEITYTGGICDHIGSCTKIHQKRCKYDLECNKKDCSFKHSSDMPTIETQVEYIKNMERYLNL